MIYQVHANFAIQVWIFNGKNTVLKTIIIFSEHEVYNNNKNSRKAMNHKYIVTLIKYHITGRIHEG
jgi:hypothetical protein